jgi:hypothetical protein
VVIPVTRLMAKERITWHSIAGGVIAVAGAAGLAWLK